MYMPDDIKRKYAILNELAKLKIDSYLDHMSYEEIDAKLKNKEFKERLAQLGPLSNHRLGVVEKYAEENPDVRLEAERLLKVRANG
jgi:hypothetical protein